MGFFIGLILFGIPSAIIASVKGFKPFRWLIALGLIGLIVVSSLSSANARGITEEEAQLRTVKANSIGATMALINVGLSVILIFVVLVSTR